MANRESCVNLSMTGVFLVASGEIFSFPYIFESITLLFHHHSTMTASDKDSDVLEASATAITSFIIVAY